MEGTLCGSAPGLELIETLGWDGHELIRLDRHLARLDRSAARLGWPRPEGAAEALRAACPPGPARMRLTLDAGGRIAVSHGALAPVPPVWRLDLAPTALNADDPWLRLKTNRRALYDAARAALPAGIDERIFQNQHGEICEGTISNLFFDLGQGLMTPPLCCGLLPGILRETLLAEGRCHEAVLYVHDLPRARLWAGNSLRGLIAARMA